PFKKKFTSFSCPIARLVEVAARRCVTREPSADSSPQWANRVLLKLALLVQKLTEPTRHPRRAGGQGSACARPCGAEVFRSSGLRAGWYSQSERRSEHAGRHFVAVVSSQGVPLVGNPHVDISKGTALRNRARDFAPRCLADETMEDAR